MALWGDWGNPLDDEAEAIELQQWRDYWSALTPAERESESRAMADYATEADY